LIKRRNIDAESYKSIAGLPPVGWRSRILRRSTDACSDDEKDIHLLMKEILLASLLGLATPSSAMIEVAVGLYVPISKRLLGCILAFASGGLISALAIELAFNRRSSFTISALASRRLVARRQRLRHRRDHL
jgi:hypothetical protein